MSNNMPSMTALLGLLALAGYQNRGKISEMLKGATASASQPPTGASHPPALGGLLGNLSGMLGGAGAGGFSAEGSKNCLRNSSRTVMARQHSPGSAMVRTSK
jgi:hypothetical protein